MTPRANHALVGPLAQARLGGGQLRPVVHAPRLARVLGDDADHPVAGLGQHLDDVGQVVLPLRVVRVHHAQRRGQEAPAEAEDPGVDLVDRELVGGGVGLLHDPGDAVIVADPHDPAVAGGVVEHRGEDRAGRPGVPVLGHEAGHRLGPQERRVAGDHEDVAVVLRLVVLGQTGEADGHRVARAPLDGLLDELERQPRAVLGELLRDPLGAMPDDDHRPLELGSGQRVEDVEHHRPPAQQVQRLRPGRPHPRALTSGKDHSREPSIGHGNGLPRETPFPRAPDHVHVSPEEGIPRSPSRRSSGDPGARSRRPHAPKHEKAAPDAGGPTWPHLRRPRPAPQAPPDRSRHVRAPKHSKAAPDGRRPTPGRTCGGRGRRRRPHPTGAGMSQQACIQLGGGLEPPTAGSKGRCSTN